LLAMIPAALNAGAPASIILSAPDCAGGQRAVTIPMRSDAPVPGDGQPCCIKGYHSGSSRKRFLPIVDV
jgi:hypothetical protein